jgi:hypothetical protein
MNRFATVLRWTARVVGTALLVLIVSIAIGEGGPNPLTVSLRENLVGTALITMMVGQILAWKWEGIGGVLILGAFALFAAVNPGVHINSSLLVVGAWVGTGSLYLACWWKEPKATGG